jgi:Na+-transporting methylmalonyl-CoA/oxaloacetate decarboxylase gamma subunit
VVLASSDPKILLILLCLAIAVIAKFVTPILKEEEKQKKKN